MTFYSAVIAKQFGLPKEDIEKLVYAAPLHDIGKIGIPDKILLKPGKLTNEEFELMKKHTLMGYEMLKESINEYLISGKDIALYHHEWSNGNGYPKGIRGNKLPVFAIIATVADVFDALTSNRPYRKEPFSLDQAFMMIKEERGTQFDPDIIDAFFKGIDNILFFKEKFKDTKKSEYISMFKEARFID